MTEYEYRIVPHSKGDHTTWYSVEYRDKAHTALFPESQLWTVMSDEHFYGHGPAKFYTREAARVWIDRDIAKRRPKPEEQIEYYPPKVMRRSSEHEQ